MPPAVIHTAQCYQYIFITYDFEICVVVPNGTTNRRFLLSIASQPPVHKNTLEVTFNNLIDLEQIIKILRHLTKKVY